MTSSNGNIFRVTDLLCGDNQCPSINWWFYKRYMQYHMMTSSNGNIFRVTDLLCGELQRPVTRSFEVFFICARINGWVNNREAGDLRRHQAHCDVIVMIWITFTFYLWYDSLIVLSFEIWMRITWFSSRKCKSDSVATECQPCGSDLISIEKIHGRQPSRYQYMHWVSGIENFGTVLQRVLPKNGCSSSHPPTDIICLMILLRCAS